MEDLVFITIDCWRDDAPNYMPKFRRYVREEGWEHTSVIASSANTSNTFPTIFSSRYYPQVWNKDGTIRESITIFPELLGEHGYSTAGYVASNPWLDRWKDEFQTFWNGGIEESNRLTFRLKRMKNLLAMRPLIPAEKVFRRAESWWNRSAPPRLLWIHLMEPHQPYLPGFTRGMRIGPALSPLSLAAAPRYNDSEFPEWLRSHSKNLYKQSVRRMDEKLTAWLQSQDDATIVITGDHGEEFHHGVVSHRQLYDETVRVPLFANKKIGHLTDGYTRQLDIAPTLLEHLKIDRPPEWFGSPSSTQMPPQKLLCGPDEEMGKIWAGIRTADEKLIQTLDYDWNVIDTEFYSLSTDPDELYPDEEAPEHLRKEVTEFINQPDIREPLQDWHPELGLVDTSNVERRLKHLGYVD